jgi:hypothetical protein
LPAPVTRSAPVFFAAQREDAALANPVTVAHPFANETG